MDASQSATPICWAAAISIGPVWLRSAIRSARGPTRSHRNSVFRRVYDIDDFLARKDIDAVAVLTPSGMHPEHVIACARAGKHVVVEKPMALRLQDADAMIRACDEAGVKLFVVKQNRFNVPVVKAREALDAGRFGGLFWAPCACAGAGIRPITIRTTGAEPGPMTAACSSNQASHHVDMLEWFFGDVVSVHARAITALANIETEDTAVATLKFSNGALGIIEATTAARPTDLEGSLSILGENGTVEIAGFAVNQIRHWRFVERTGVRQGRDREIFGQSAERLRLRPSGLLSARDRLPDQSARGAGRRPRGTQEPGTDFRALRVDRNRRGSPAAFHAPAVPARSGVVNQPDLQHAGIRDVEFGARVKVVEPCNLYGCRIGDDCFVGPFTEIQKSACRSAPAPACSRMPSSASW